MAALGLIYLAMLAARLFAPRALPEAFLAPGERAAQTAPLAGFVWGGILTLILCSPALAQMGHLVGTVKSSSEVDVMQEYQNPLWTLAEGLRTLVGPGSGPTGVLSLIAALAARNYALPKQNFPGPIAYLAALHVPAESVGAVGLAADAYADYLRPGWRKVESVADLEALKPSQGSRWVVIAFPGRTSRRYAEVMALLGRDFDIIRRFPGTLGDGGIWLFRSKASTGR